MTNKYKSKNKSKDIVYGGRTCTRKLNSSSTSSRWRMNATSNKILLIGVVIGIVITETIRNMGTSIVTDYLIQSQLSAVSDIGYGSTSTNTSTSSSSIFYDDKNNKKKKKYAIAVYADKNIYLHGVYSMIQQSKKTGLFEKGDVDFVVITSIKLLEVDDSRSSMGNILKQWLEDGLIHQLKFVDNKSIILDIVPHGLWPGVFNKLFFFNLTDYDKVITLDCDVFIRQNIYHWFTDYDTPAACQAKGLLEWNSGAMIISPSTEIFNSLLGKLPLIIPWYTNNKKFPQIIDITKNDLDQPDPWQNRIDGNNDQNFLTSFFTADKDTNSIWRMKSMPRENSILSSELNNKALSYFWYRRNHIFDTVHLTLHKPWRGRHASVNEAMCTVLYEFYISVLDIHIKYNVTEITNPYLAKCPNTTTTWENYIQIANNVTVIIDYGIDTSIGSSNSSSSSSDNISSSSAVVISDDNSRKRSKS